MGSSMIGRLKCNMLSLPVTQHPELQTVQYTLCYCVSVHTHKSLNRAFSFLDLITAVLVMITKPSFYQGSRLYNEALADMLITWHQP